MTAINTMTTPDTRRDDLDIYDDLPDNYDDDYEAPCYLCDGYGYGIVGVDWDSDDYINGPYEGDLTVCPCCHGSGNGKDETFW